ncbi:MAG: arsenate reductase (azurin) small subunit [Rhodospirillaceae bacterium]|nr:MAG: arsenate reductase (azurin) small subunit [Rhodospirillaceae bacterium]
MTKSIKSPVSPTTEKEKTGDDLASHQKCMMTRRQFLLTSGTATATVMLMMKFGAAEAAVPAMVTKYPRKLLGKMSKLKNDEPVLFNYPDDGDYSDSLLVKLGTEGGGGIGANKDIVAFNQYCTHQGASLDGTYKAATKSLGACPLHLSTFDLTRHGIVISGQAYQSVPQVLLEVDGDNIYAVGMMGLIYGRNNNLKG